jgi:hypothetical protein
MFRDVPKGHWAYNDINLAHQLGIVVGFEEPDGTYTFRPDEPVTRAQAACFCVRTWKVGLCFAGGFAALALAISVVGSRRKKAS